MGTKSIMEELGERTRLGTSQQKGYMALYRLKDVHTWDFQTERSANTKVLR